MGRSQATYRDEVRQVKYRLDIRPDAVTDIEIAATWYEDKDPALATDFIRIIFNTIETIQANPAMHRVRNRKGSVRWVLTPRFPYRIVYRVQDELITVFARPEET